jgi:hypothetical protein
MERNLRRISPVGRQPHNRRRLHRIGQERIIKAVAGEIYGIALKHLKRPLCSIGDDDEHVRGDFRDNGVGRLPDVVHGWSVIHIGDGSHRVGCIQSQEGE